MIGVSFKVKLNNINSLLNRVNLLSSNVVHKIADEYVQQVKLVLSDPSSPSIEGEPPALVTGTLRSSVRKESVTKDSVVVHAAEGDAYYGFFHEFGYRHGTRSFMGRAREDLSKYIDFKRFRL